MMLGEWISHARKKAIYTVLTCSALFCGCGEDSKISIPTVEGFESPAEDTDLLPIYDRAHYQWTLQDDGHCRVRYTADFDYDVYSGNHPISERTSPTYQYAAQVATRYESEGRCRKKFETCAIVPLRRGFALTINGDRLSRFAELTWEELARHVNYLYRHQLCQSM